jgi:hypothetical protein
MTSRAASTRHRYVDESSPNDASVRHAAAWRSGLESK